MRILFVWPNKDQFGFKPMSISLLSAILKKQGHEVDLFDTTFIDFGFKDNTEVRSRLKIFKEVDLDDFDLAKRKIDLEQTFVKKLNNFQPDIVSISALSDEVPIGLEISKIAKQWDRKILVLWGNKAPTMEPRKILDDENVDYICRGEGIEFISNFIEAVRNKTKPDRIKGIGYRDRGGKIVLKDLPPYYKDLDHLPFFDWSIFDSRHFLKPFDGKLYRGGDHMIYWGCPNQCTYCINSSYRKLYGPDAGNFLRGYSVDRIVRELRYLVDKWDINFFKFHDEDFCLKPIIYFRELAEKYAAEIGVPFTIMANARTITSEKVSLLKKMNCVSVTLGIETGNHALRRDVLKRSESEDEIVEATKMLNDADIRTSSFNMLGIPFENRKTVMETIELNKRAGIRYPNAGFFFPLKGTELRKIAIENGFFDSSSEEVFQNDRPVLKFRGISKTELIALHERFVLYIKMPRQFYKYIERSEKDDEMGKKLTERLYKIYDDCVFRNNGIWNDRGNAKKYIDELEGMLEGIRYETVG